MDPCRGENVMKTIKESACHWLCHVARTENGKTIGLPYAKVLEKIRLDIPTARTSNASLRVYATQIKHMAHGFTGYTLPDCRPRGGD